MSADIKQGREQMKKNNYVKWCFRILIRKISWSIIKGCYTISNKRFTSSTKKIHGSETTTLVISNEKMADVMKTIQALEDSGILLKVISK